MFVLDEADEMLSRGFKDQIYDIFTKLPNNVQVWQSCCKIYAPHLQMFTCKFLEM